MAKKCVCSVNFDVCVEIPHTCGENPAKRLYQCPVCKIMYTGLGVMIKTIPSNNVRTSS